MAYKEIDQNERIKSSTDQNECEQSTPTFSADKELATPATIDTPIDITRSTPIDTAMDTTMDTTMDKTLDTSSNKSIPLMDREQFTPKTNTTAITRTTIKSSPTSNGEQFTPKSTAAAKSTHNSVRDQSPVSKTSNAKSVGASSSLKKRSTTKKKEKEKILKKMVDTGDIPRKDETSTNQINSMNIPDPEKNNKENVLEYGIQGNQNNEENRPDNDNENVSDQPSVPNLNMKELMKESITSIEDETGVIIESSSIIIQEDIEPMDSTPPIICDSIMEWIQPDTHSQTRKSSFSIAVSSRRSSRRESIKQSHALSPSRFPSGPMPHFSSNGLSQIVSDGLSILPSVRSFIIQPDQIELVNGQGSSLKSISDSNNSKRNSFIRRNSSFSPFKNASSSLSSPKPMTGISIPIDSFEDNEALSNFNEHVFQNKRIFIPGFTPQTAGKDNFLTLPGIDVSQKLVEDQFINHSIAIGPLERKATVQKNQSIGKQSKRVSETGAVKKSKGLNEQAKQPNGSTDPNMVKKSKGKKISFEASSDPSDFISHHNLDAPPTTLPDHNHTDTNLHSHPDHENPNNYSDTSPIDYSDSSPNNYSDASPHNYSDTSPNPNSYSISKNQDISMNDNELDRYMEYNKPKPKERINRKCIITYAQKKLNYLESIRSKKGPDVRPRLPPCPRELRNLILWKEIPQTLLDMAVEKRLELDKNKEEERERKERGVCVGDEGWNSHIRKPTIDPRIQLEKLSEKMKKLIMMMT